RGASVQESVGTRKLASCGVCVCLVGGGFQFSAPIFPDRKARLATGPQCSSGSKIVRRQPVLCDVSQILVPALSRKRRAAASHSRLRLVFATVMLVKLSLGGMPRSQSQRFSEWSSYCSLTYSALACFRMGMSGSASFQRAKKSWYAAFALVVSPESA